MSINNILNFNNKQSDDITDNSDLETSWYQEGKTRAQDLYNQIPDGPTITTKKAVTVGVGTAIAAWLVSELFG